MRRQFPDQGEALALLPANGQAVVRGRYEDDRTADEESELVAYFDFSDLIEVVTESFNLRRRVTDRSRNGWSRYSGGLVQLRNDVMHPVRNAVLAKGGLVRLRGREQRIRGLIERVEEALKTTE